MGNNDGDRLGPVFPGGRVTLFMIRSAINDNVYGPFVNRDDAFDFAESADGSVFECAARLVDIKEV